MGQYYVIANLDKKEFLDPYGFGDGLKLMEFAMSGKGVLSGLAVLLASSNGQGGGDLHLPHDSEFHHVPGRWAGDRIVVAGDYDSDEHSPGNGVYSRCNGKTPLEELAGAVSDTANFTDISAEVLGCLLEDSYFREDFLRINSDNPTWAAYKKTQNRKLWDAARPNDAVPAELA